MYIEWPTVIAKIDPTIFLLTNETKDTSGTAFLINKEEDGWLFFLTARHNAYPDGSVISIKNNKASFSNVGVFKDTIPGSDLCCLMAKDTGNVFSKKDIPSVISPDISLLKGTQIGFLGFAYGTNSLASDAYNGNVLDDCSAGGPWFRHGYISTKSNILTRYIVNGDSSTGMSGCPAFTQLDNGEIVYVGVLSEAATGIIIVDELPPSGLVNAALNR